MRHGKKINQLGRKSTHRKAMLSNMASSLVMHKHISTTVAKAKVLRTYVEPLITKSKNDTTHSRRTVFSYLQNKEAVVELFKNISSKIGERPGGYTRILKTGNRLGDNADMCRIELVDYSESFLGAKQDTKTKTGRQRRGTGKKKATDSTTKKSQIVSTSQKEKSKPSTEPRKVSKSPIKDQRPKGPKSGSKAKD